MSAHQHGVPALPEGLQERIPVLDGLLKKVEGSYDADQDRCLVLLGLVVDRLPSPAASIYADLGGAPDEAAPADGAAAAAERAAAAHLRLAAALVRRLDAAALGLQQLFDSRGPGGSAAVAQASQQFRGLVIEEVDDEEASAAQQARRRLFLPVLLAAGLYGAGQALRRPWARPPASEAAAGLLHALAAHAPAGLQPALPGGAAIAAAPPASGPQQPAAEAAAIDALVAAALPAAAAALRPTFGAYVAHQSSPSTRLDPYTGPETFERFVAGSQLAWLALQLRCRGLGEALPALLPAALALVDDPSPAVQSLGLVALAHAAHAGPAADLRRHSALLMDAACRAARACDDRAWPAAAEAVVAVAVAVEGPDPHAAGYLRALDVLLDEGERGSAHSVARAAAWLDTAPRLFEPLGLQLVSRSSRLLPLLLGWAAASSPRVRLAALRALHHAVALTWPRIPAHAAALWTALARVHANEAAFRSGAAAEDIRRAAVEAAEAVWLAGGPDFQHALLAGPSSSPASEAGNELLLAVMEAVERDQEEGAAPLGGADAEQPAEEAVLQDLGRQLAGRLARQLGVGTEEL